VAAHERKGTPTAHLMRRSRDGLIGLANENAVLVMVRRGLGMDRKRQGLSNAGYGKRCGLSGAYIGRLVRSGQIPTLADGSIDPEAADQARARNVRLRMVPPSPRQIVASPRQSNSAKHGGDYWAARTVREHFAAKLLQLEFARESGKVLDADKVLQLTAGAFSNCRTRLRGMGKSLAPLLQHRSVGEIEKLLNDAIDGALEALSANVLSPCVASQETNDAVLGPNA